ncbi:hypothetical protein D3C79_723950 [compost metagenome]
MAQAVEVDIGAGIDGHQGLALHPFTCHVLLDPRHGQGARRFGDRAGIVVDVLDRCAQLVAADRDHLIDEVAAQLETMGADLRHRHAVGKRADLRQDHPLARGHRSLQAIGVFRFDTDHFDLRPQVLHISGDPGDQSAAANRHEDRVQCPRLLTQDLHGHRALPGDHIGVIEWRHEGRALAVGQGQRVGQGMGEALTVQHHMTAARAHPFDLQRWRSGRHDDGRPHPQVRSGQGHALGMVAGRGRDHAALALGHGEA